LLETSYRLALAILCNVEVVSSELCYGLPVAIENHDI
jgi:hypothetical protein